uniref:AlNc14C110G6347 protein n=1 Tax=Albugo laibachii Nc14 TaxID=890382 RepID=F0WIE8_9STRA|nr:AlNc14C110G6347 [Albugo laibachii Nc14]|eukprot:CCA21029.1 AlNc14C110G6347 [Albugo laibachii Nc14]
MDNRALWTFGVLSQSDVLIKTKKMQLDKRIHHTAYERLKHTLIQKMSRINCKSRLLCITKYVTSVRPTIQYALYDLQYALYDQYS